MLVCCIGIHYDHYLTLCMLSTLTEKEKSVIFHCHNNVYFVYYELFSVNCLHYIFTVNKWYYVRCK